MKRKRLLGPVIICALAVLFQTQDGGGHSASAAANRYLIRPGRSVGNIYIGASRQRVRRVAGEPISSLDDGDQFAGFTVGYIDDRVTEIIVSSPRYRTSRGISVRSTPERFLRAYPQAKVSCYVEGGASAVTTGKTFDEVERGIAFDRQVFEGRSREVIHTITVHEPGVPARVYGEPQPCEEGVAIIQPRRNQTPPSCPNKLQMTSGESPAGYVSRRDTKAIAQRFIAG